MILLSCVEEKMKKITSFGFKTITVFQSNQFYKPLYSICVRNNWSEIELMTYKKTSPKKNRNTFKYEDVFD